jgi:hypothetical protein
MLWGPEQARSLAPMFPASRPRPRVAGGMGLSGMPAVGDGGGWTLAQNAACRPDATGRAATGVGRRPGGLEPSVPPHAPGLRPYPLSAAISTATREVREVCRLWTQSVRAEAPPTGHPVSLPKVPVGATSAATSEAGALSDGAICWNRSPSHSAPSALAASFPYASDLSRDERNGRPHAIGANSVGTEVPPTVHPASKPQVSWGATPGWPQAIGRDVGSGSRDGVRQCWAENTSTTHPEQPGPSPALPSRSGFNRDERKRRPSDFENRRG